MNALDRFTSKGFRDVAWFAAVLCVALVGCCITIVHGDEPLNVAAIAGRPVAVAQSGPALDLTAIARCNATAGELCKCPGCPLETPHRCGDPGCLCGAVSAVEPLNLVAISPKRTATAVTTTKPVIPAAAVPKYQWQQVCNGRFCEWKIVRIE